MTLHEPAAAPPEAASASLRISIWGCSNAAQPAYGQQNAPDWCKLPIVKKPAIPRALLDPVVEYFRPQRVILFGSRARGESTRDSDIDLLVVVNDDAPPEKLISPAGREAQGSYRGAADVFPIRAEAFERERAVANTLSAEADADGIVVYGPPKGPCMKAPDPRARWQAVDDWLAVAEMDKRGAEVLLAADPPALGLAAFHCQQALEKLLKGFLTLAGRRGRKTHSLAQLGAAAVAGFPDIAEPVSAAKNWSNWAVDFRYPSQEGRIKPPPEQDELRRALDVIDALARRLRAANPKPPEP